MWRLLEVMAGTRSLLLMGAGALLLVVASLVLLPIVIVAAVGTLVFRLGRRFAAALARMVRLQRLVQVAQQPSRKRGRPLWFTDLYQAIERREVDALVDVANRQRHVRAWYAPTAFWPQWTKLERPHVICLPDIVLTDAPAGFAHQDAGGRFRQTLTRIEETIAGGTSFSTYSRHVADAILQQRFGVPPERITVIPHAPARLDQWVEVRGTPDDVTGTLEYARGLLGMALARATNPAYAVGFANTRVRFIFYASQFRPSKNIVSLLRVYERLLRRHYIPVKLILTGDPDSLPEIPEFIAEHRLEQDVLCLCNLTSQELAACYKLAELAVNPTLSEGGCPFTLTEALSVGTPVVMSRIAVTTEVVTDPELQRLMLFDPCDPAAMEERIVWALHHRDELLRVQLPLYRQLNQRTWDEVVDDHLVALEHAVQHQSLTAEEGSALAAVRAAQSHEARNR
jgi:glycosyltransferase involved in cell wall biosynthesis